MPPLYTKIVAGKWAERVVMKDINGFLTCVNVVIFLTGRLSASGALRLSTISGAGLYICGCVLIFIGVITP